MSTFETVAVGLLIYIALVATLDLFVDLWGAKAKKARISMNDIVDEGITIAEQRSRSIKLPSSTKHTIAVDWAEGQCKRLGLKTNRNELSKRVELRLGLAKK